jgi:hypothetical protein
VKTVSVRLPSGTIVSVSEPNTTANNVGPYGVGVSPTDPVSEPPKSSNYIGPYGAGVDPNDR